MPADGDAVVFRSCDYASFGRRVGSCLIDIAVVTACFLALQLYLTNRYVPREVQSIANLAEKKRLIDKYMAPAKQQMVFGDFAIIAAYFLLARRLPGGTFGYRATGIRLVDETGGPPRWWPLTKRLFIIGGLTMLGMIPCTLLISAGKVSNPFVQAVVTLGSTAAIIYLAYKPCGTHEKRQAMHDQWSGTWVVRKRAEPVGRALPRYHTIFLGTMPIRYLDLEAAPASQSDSDIVALPPSARPVTELRPPISADAR